LGRHGVPLIAGVLVAAVAARALGAAMTPRERAIVLLGDGIGQTARFGQSEAAAVATLDRMFGSPTTAEPVTTNDCNVDADLQLPGMVAYFDHGRFVGYSTVARAGEARGGRDLATSRGLDVGDILAVARRLYGRALRTSLAQGGSWFAATPHGRLEGFLDAEVAQVTPPPRILSIGAGALGCPAMSP
jgi:hypothetical protein